MRNAQGKSAKDERNVDGKRFRASITISATLHLRFAMHNVVTNYIFTFLLSANRVLSHVHNVHARCTGTEGVYYLQR